MRKSISRLWRCSALALGLAALLLPEKTFAQSGTVAGVVIGTGGRPLPTVTVPATGQRATTDTAGLFTLTGLSGAEVVIETRRLGFWVDRRQVRVGNVDLQIPLIEQSVSLDAVVVTGTAGAQAARELGNAVSRIDVSAVAELGTTNSVQQLLNGRAPGVFVNPSSGVAGSGARIRIRGARFTGPWRAVRVCRDDGRRVHGGAD